MVRVFALISPLCTSEKPRQNRRFRQITSFMWHYDVPVIEVCGRCIWNRKVDQRDEAKGRLKLNRDTSGALPYNTTIQGDGLSPAGGIWELTFVGINFLLLSG